MERLRQWARGVKRDVLALALAARDPRVPWTAKLVAVAVAAYALSPIDLIPDFIPVLGYLDDLVIVPAGILLAIKLVPPGLMAEFRETASRHNARPNLGRWGALLIVALWIIAIALLVGALFFSGTVRREPTPKSDDAAGAQDVQTPRAVTETDDQSFPVFAQEKLRWMKSEYSAGRLELGFFSDAAEALVPPDVFMATTRLRGEGENLLFKLARGSAERFSVRRRVARARAIAL
jgi:uncharacterized membrane protein YkvA (DUF1232 family)